MELEEHGTQLALYAKKKRDQVIQSGTTLKTHQMLVHQLHVSLSHVEVSCFSKLINEEAVASVSTLTEIMGEPLNSEVEDKGLGHNKPQS